MDAWDALAAFDDADLLPMYPFFWWRHGDRRQKTPGVFYARAEDHPDAGPPWEPSSLYDGEDGLVAQALNIAVVAVRTTPFRTVKGPDGKTVREYEREWREGMSVHTEILCLAEGLSGLSVLSLKGLSGKAFTARGGILDRARDVVRAVNVDGRRPPLAALWIAIATERDKSGIVYRDTGYGSYVTLPALAWHEDEPAEIWAKHRVPDGALDFVAQMSDEVRRWKQYSRARDGASTRARDGASTRARDGGDDGDMPF
jgi:hypothetical protein